MSGGVLAEGNHDSIVGNFGKKIQKYTDPLAMIPGGFGDKWTNLTSVEIPRMSNTALSKVIQPFDKVDETINPARKLGPVDKVSDLVRDKPASAIGTAVGAFFGGGALAGLGGAGGGGAGGAAGSATSAGSGLGSSTGAGMFDLNTLFNTAGTQGYTNGLGMANPDFGGSFAGLADSFGGIGSGASSLDPSVLAQISKQASPQQNTPRVGGAGLGARLSASGIQDLTKSQATNTGRAEARGGLSKFIYGK